MNGNINKEEQRIEALKELFENEDFSRIWYKMHTPLKRSHKKINRNDICPFCDSGKKFKNCKCYSKYGQMEYYN